MAVSFDLLFHSVLVWFCSLIVLCSEIVAFSNCGNLDLSGFTENSAAAVAVELYSNKYDL